MGGAEVSGGELGNGIKVEHEIGNEAPSAVLLQPPAEESKPPGIKTDSTLPWCPDDA